MKTVWVRFGLAAALVSAGSVGQSWAAENATTANPSAEAGGTVTLDPLTVEGRGGSANAAASTEATRSYTSPVASVGSKGPVSLRDIPQSVTVVTRQRIEDQNMTRLEDALRRATGTTILTNDHGRSSIFSRGYELDAYMVDGLPSPLSSVYGTQPDLAPFDRIEVLRGPAGLFSGTGEPGGTVNLARKRALGTFSASGSGTAGSWNSYRAEADVTGPLVESGKARARAVGVFTDRDTFIDTTHNAGKVGYGTVELDLTEQTTLSFVVSREVKDITPFNGLPSYADGRLLDVSRSTFIGADWNRFDNSSNEAMIDLEHRFDDGGEARAAVRFVDRDVDFKYAYAGSFVNPVTNTVTMTALARQYEEESLAADVHVSRPFDLFGQTHNVTVGADYRRYDQELGQGTATVPGTVNVFNPTSNLAEPTIRNTLRTRNVPEQYAGYAQLRVKPITPVTAILGGRLSYYNLETTNLITNAVSEVEVDGEFTPQLGLIYDLTKNFSAYASFTEIFQPQTTLASNGKPLDPRKGEQFEIGLKGEFLDGDLTSSIGFFRTKDTNRPVANPATPGFSTAAGEVESKGIELEVGGSPLPGWNIFSSYSYLLSEYLVGTPAQVGQVFNTWTPKHTFNLWTTYDFGEGPLDGFSVGAGAKAVSSYYAQSGATRWTQDAYALFDAQIGYDLTKNVSATLSVNNILDKEYYSRTAGSTLFNYYGEPRSYWLKVAAKL
ncbi:TonB-dependent siderophore receptor [Skermanella stibiiresistens]|nr:TonB-dependent siderophore receptor [Skermanella stibiiresistens]